MAVLMLKEVYYAEDMLSGGLADEKKPEDFDQRELSRGIKVELEHTDNPDLAREIAMDHLTEDPFYYQKLATIEAKTPRGRKLSEVYLVTEIDKEEAENYYHDILRRNPELHDQLERIARFALATSRSSKGPSEADMTMQTLFNKNRDLDPFRSGDTMGVEMYIDHLAGEDAETAGKAKRFYNNIFNSLLKNRYKG